MVTALSKPERLSPGFSPKPAKRRYDYFAEDSTPSPSPSSTPPPVTESPKGRLINRGAGLFKKRAKVNARVVSKPQRKRN